MPTEVISNIYLNYGLFGLVVIAFFVLVIWVIRRNAEREDRLEKTAAERENKLYAIIDALSEQLPHIRETLARIESRIDKK